MSSLNRVTLIGHLGADPETRSFSGGTLICNLRLATSERWKDRTTGEPKEATEWHRVVLYRRLAEIADQYLRKGAQIYVEGRLRTRKWTDKTGVERVTTEIEGDDFKMLGKGSQETSSANRLESKKVTLTKTADYFENDPIPF